MADPIDPFAAAETLRGMYGVGGPPPATAPSLGSFSTAPAPGGAAPVPQQDVRPAQPTASPFVPEDEELQRNLAEADAALAQQEQGIDPFGVAAGQASALMDVYAKNEEKLAKMGPVVSSSPNQAFPIVQRRMGERVGTGQLDYPDFQPEPWKDLPRFEGESDEDYAARNQLFAEADLRTQADDYQRLRAEAYAQAGQLTPEYDTRQLGGVLGFEEAQRQGQERVDAATQTFDQEAALAQTIASTKQAEATKQAADAVELQRQREEEGLAAVQQIRGVRDEARKKLAAMPEINRQRVARELSTGTKFAAVLGAMAQGWRGDAITAVNDAIDRGVNEEFANYERARAEYGDIVAQSDESMNMLDFLVNSMGGNVRAAAQMRRQMAMEDALSEFDAKIAAATIPVNRERMVQARVALEQQLRDETDAMELEARTTPRNFVRVSDPYRSERKALTEEQKEIRGELKDIRGDVRGSAEKAVDREAAVELEGVKSRGAADVKRAEKEAEGEAKIKEKTIAFGAAEQMIDEFLERNPGNIHGVGMFGTGEKDQRIDTDSFRIGLKQTIITAWTGANASPEQQVEFERLIEGDWTEWNDEEFRARLRSLKRLVGSQRRYLQQSLRPETPAVQNTREFSTFQPR